MNSGGWSVQGGIGEKENLAMQSNFMPVSDICCFILSPIVGMPGLKQKCEAGLKHTFVGWVFRVRL